uniref:DUF4604 domain-containing protein n=1 Tax=Panstrongylus megistus TaxID=65343 RepID=A0A069DNR6_9HEMI
MSKKNVSYIKPQEPAFLARLKKQVGYEEGPTVDTKREQLPVCSSDESDGEDQPQVVVIKPGDLTAEEAEKAKKELEETPADLNRRVIFKKPEKKVEDSEKKEIRSNKRSLEKQNGPKQKHTKPVLSFDEEDEDNS